LLNIGAMGSVIVSWDSIVNFNGDARVAFFSPLLLENSVIEVLKSSRVMYLARWAGSFCTTAKSAD